MRQKQKIREDRKEQKNNNENRTTKRHYSERDLCGRYSFDVGVLGGEGSSESSWPAYEHVDNGVLDQRREDEQQTDDHPNVDCFDVRDARQRRLRTVTRRRRRQHGQ